LKARHKWNSKSFPLAPPAEEVTRAFVEIVNASAADPEAELSARVSDIGYRNAFLKLTRNLAPTGKSFTELEIRSSVEPALGTVVLAPDSRKAINDTIRKQAPALTIEEEGNAVKLEGILRAVHLDQDWLEVTVVERGEQHIKVWQTGEVIDDVIGSMVNRRVTVDAVLAPNGKHVFKDIQSVE
jgi:hypothetical protein